MSKSDYWRNRPPHTAHFVASDMMNPSAFIAEAMGQTDTPQPKSVTEWMFDMYGWAHRVRMDILRLEAAAQIGIGDPGSPPLPPPPLDADLVD